MTLFDCILECLENKKFVDEYNRLNRCNITSNMKLEITQLADGKIEDTNVEINKFITFVFNFVWPIVNSVYKKNDEYMN